MSMSAYIYRLSLTHARLQEAIRRELKQRFPDSLRVARLKKLRLAIKDRLASHGFPGADNRRFVV